MTRRKRFKMPVIQNRKEYKYTMSNFVILLSVITFHLRETTVDAAFFIAPFSLNQGNRLQSKILQKHCTYLKMKKTKKIDEHRQIENLAIEQDQLDRHKVKPGEKWLILTQSGTKPNRDAYYN